MTPFNRLLSSTTAALCAATVLSLLITASVEGATADMEPMESMRRITTQAQAQELKPGDSMAMVCTKCKEVFILKVKNDSAHVKMMTIGEKVTCKGCGGTVEVVATGNGGMGTNAEVKHVCSKCGDDAMFCTATVAGK